MKILISAIACEPKGVSEGYVGWQAVKTLSELVEHEFWVLTSITSQSSIEQAQIEGLISANVHFIFHGEENVWSENRLVARMQSWRVYQKWTSSLLKVAAKLHDKIGFDLVHHITYVTWRVACPLWQLGIPMVWGPIGGGETFPKGLISILSFQARFFEVLRDGSNFISMNSSKVKQCARKASHVFVANSETEILMGKVGTRAELMSRLAGSFFDKAHMAKFTLPVQKNYESERLELFAGGNLEGRKGVAIALRALTLVAGKGVKFRYTLGGNGPERDFLMNLAKEYGIADSVEFTDGFRGDAYAKKLADSHIYLLPSLRDNAPITLMEAMLSGCVPVVARCGGPAEIVDEECGFRIVPHSLQQMATGIAQYILQLYTDRPLLKKKGQAARLKITYDYSAENYKSRIGAVYKTITHS